MPKVEIYVVDDRRMHALQALIEEYDAKAEFLSRLNYTLKENLFGYAGCTLINIVGIYFNLKHGV